jgi:hypothetical protein
MALWIAKLPQPKIFTILINGLVKVLADIQFVISSFRCGGKVVKRKFAKWMSQCQCFATKADSSGDVINVTAFVETGDEGAP